MVKTLDPGICPRIYVDLIVFTAWILDCRLFTIYIKFKINSGKAFNWLPAGNKKRVPFGALGFIRCNIDVYWSSSIKWLMVHCGCRRVLQLFNHFLHCHYGILRGYFMYRKRWVYAFCFCGIFLADTKILRKRRKSKLVQKKKRGKLRERRLAFSLFHLP